MEKFYSHDLKCMIQQINKRVAGNLFNDGYDIFLHPSNLRFDNVWQHPMECQKNGFSFVGHSFDQICNSFEVYNCDKERGRYIHFFVKC